MFVCMCMSNYMINLFFFTALGIALKLKFDRFRAKSYSKSLGHGSNDLIDPCNII